MIDLAKGFELDDRAVTTSFSLLGMKGSGKSNAAVLLAEQLFDARVPWVAIDPKGDWWGVRAGSKGLPVPIFGGLHADVPIDPAAGGLFADLIVDQHLTALIDTSELSKGENVRFLTAFFDRLYRKKNRSTYPMHLILEECDDYVPQKVYREIAQLVRTVELIVKRGRARGLGITLASQRAASINKDALTQTDVLIALRTTSPQDRKAIEAWLSWHATSREIAEQLPTLQSGAAWVSWPERSILQQVMFRRRRTFDSGATPELGDKVKAATLADIDVAAITASVGDLVDRAAADNPTVLRARIRELERRLAGVPLVAPEPVEVEVVREVVPPAAIAAAADLRRALAEYEERRKQLAANVMTVFTKIVDQLAVTPDVTSAPKPLAGKSQPRPNPLVPERRDRPVNRPAPGAVSPRLGDNAPTKVLRAVVQSGGGITKKRAAAIAGISPKSSTLRGALADLRRDGLLEGPGDHLTATAAGVTAAGDVQLPHGEELLDHWRAQLGTGAPRLILDALWAQHGPLDKDQLEQATGISAKSSTMRGGLAKLRGLGLVAGYELDPDFAEAVSR